MLVGVSTSSEHFIKCTNQQNGNVDFTMSFFITKIYSADTEKKQDTNEQIN